MLRLTVPKGSLENGTFELFKRADLPIMRSDERDYSLKINDPRIVETVLLRPQEIPRYVEEGEFDIGISGLDWIIETQSTVKEVADLKFSKQGWSAVEVVLATYESNPVERVEEIDPRARVVTEYPRLTKRFFRQNGKRKVSIRLSHGATEVKVPRLADYLVDVTETGTTLKRNGKKIIEVILKSSTKLIANVESWKDESKRKAIEEIAALLKGVIAAQDKALIKMNVPKAKIKELVDYLPALRAPTISPFYSNKFYNGGEWMMIETVVEKNLLSVIIPEVKARGAKDILEINISKMIP